MLFLLSIQCDDIYEIQVHQYVKQGDAGVPPSRLPSSGLPLGPPVLYRSRTQRSTPVPQVVLKQVVLVNIALLPSPHQRFVWTEAVQNTAGWMYQGAFFSAMCVGSWNCKFGSTFRHRHGNRTNQGGWMLTESFAVLNPHPKLSLMKPTQPFLSLLALTSSYSLFHALQTTYRRPLLCPVLAKCVCVCSVWLLFTETD